MSVSVCSSGDDQTVLTAYYRDVVRRMMYCNGDLEEPLEPCVEMVLNLVKFQLIKVLKDAWKQASAQNRKLIMLEDVLFLFRRHKFLLKRLLHFAETAERINELKRAAPRTSKLDEEQDQDSEMEDDEEERDDVATASVPVSNLSRMQKYVNSLHLDMNAEQLFEMPDRELELRQRRIADIVMKEITTEEYPRFTAARTATFLDDPRRPKKSDGCVAEFFDVIVLHTNLSSSSALQAIHELLIQQYGSINKKTDPGNLLRWLGAPKCEPTVVFVLAFIGREVVAYYVDAACTVMKTEDEGLFLNEIHNGHLAADDESCPLQMRHYEEALRRCVGWRRHRDFLFGFFEDSNDVASEPSDAERKAENSRTS